MEKINLSTMTITEIDALMEQIKQQQYAEREQKREAYESLKKDLVERIAGKVHAAASQVKELYDFTVRETAAFYAIMREYGELRKEDQQTFSIKDNNFKIEVKSNKVKAFDERADIAASRLIEFLKGWVVTSDKGENDPMYQLTMLLLERNKNGDLDYKSISKLYEMERKFNNPEYSAIMELFKESNVVEKNATNFYFYEQNSMGVWCKVEPSFNRL